MVQFAKGQSGNPAGRPARFRNMATLAVEAPEKLPGPNGAGGRPYEPTPRERAAYDAQFARRQKAPRAPYMKVSVTGGVTEVRPDHPDPRTANVLLMEALGTTSPSFVDGLLGQLAKTGTQDGTVDEGTLNFLLAVVKGIGPKDQVEAMLATQMAAVQLATMTFAQRLMKAQSIPEQDIAERAFNKLARTFTTQVDALKRYRTGGQQKVTVEHVTVQPGGQAIVGTITNQGGGRIAKNEEQPHASEPRSLTYAPGTEMPCALEADREVVPVTSRERA